MEVGVDEWLNGESVYLVEGLPEIAESGGGGNMSEANLCDVSRPSSKVASYLGSASICKCGLDVGGIVIPNTASGKGSW